MNMIAYSASCSHNEAAKLVMTFMDGCCGSSGGSFSPNNTLVARHQLISWRSPSSPHTSHRPDHVSLVFASSTGSVDAVPVSSASLTLRTPHSFSPFRTLRPLAASTFGESTTTPLPVSRATCSLSMHRTRTPVPARATPSLRRASPSRLTQSDR